MASTTDGSPPRRVLVVDDDDDIREVAEVALSLVGGWDVITASDGREALGVAARERPDAILLDVMMPDMDGPTTIIHLQRDDRTRHIPVVLLTAKVQTRDHQEWGALPLAGVIAKPFDPMTLSAQVSRLLGW